MDSPNLQNIDNDAIAFSGNKQKLHPSARWLFFISYSFYYIVLICFGVIYFLFTGDVEFNKYIVYVAGALALYFIIIFFFFSGFWYKRYFFEFRKDVFYKESGVIVKHYTAIPYDCIQDIYIQRGFFARMFGLSVLKVQTAGYSHFISEGNIPGISPIFAEQLRSKILDNIKKARQIAKLNNSLYKYIENQTKTGKPIKKIEQELLGTGWNTKDLSMVFDSYNFLKDFKNKKSKNDFVGKKPLNQKVQKVFFWRAAIFVLFFMALDFAIILVILSDKEEWVVYPLVLMAFLGICLMLCSTLARLAYDNYFFEITDSIFKKESGVISKHYVSIPYNRVQNVDITRGFLERIFGLSTLKIQTAGLAKRKQFLSNKTRLDIRPEGVVPGLSHKYAEELRDEMIYRVLKNKRQAF